MYKEKIPALVQISIHSKYLFIVPVENGNKMNKNFIDKFLLKWHKFRENWKTVIGFAILSGDSISLVKSNLHLKSSNFFDFQIFKRNGQFIFWTFDDSFIFLLKTKIESFDKEYLIKIKTLLLENLEPYSYLIDNTMKPDERMGVSKCHTIKYVEEFRPVFEKDEQNRDKILKIINNNLEKYRSDALTKKEEANPSNSGMEAAAVNAVESKEKEKPTHLNGKELFLSILDDSLMPAIKVLEEMEKLMIAAWGDQYNLFKTIPQNGSGNLPTYNFRIYAFILVFNELNYFKRIVDFKEIYNQSLSI